MVPSLDNGCRILLAIDTGSLTAPALQTAAALAVGLGAELAALFVEDERLLRLAELPFARPPGFASGEWHELGRAAMEQAFRVQAGHLRRVVEAAAAPLALAWTFDVVRGELLSAALAWRRREDPLVLSKGRLAAFPVGGPPEHAGPFDALAGRPVAVLFDDFPSGVRGLEAALALAQVTAGALDVLVVAKGPEGIRFGRARAAAQLAERSAAVRHEVFDVADHATLVRTVRAQGAGALVMSGAAAERPTVEMLEDFACPVVLLA